MREDWPSTLKPTLRPTPLKSTSVKNVKMDQQTQQTQQTHKNQLTSHIIGIIIHRESISLTLLYVLGRRDDCT